MLDDTTPESTTCQCNHLTSFGSGFAVQPNAIDFDYVFDNADFLSNPTLYVTQILIAITYVAVAIWARRADKNDVKKVRQQGAVSFFAKCYCIRGQCLNMMRILVVNIMHV